MRKRLYPRAPRRVWLTVGGLASAAAVVVALTALAGPVQNGPASAPPMVFVGDTSTSTTTASPPPTVAPTRTGGPKPSGTPTASPTTDGGCLPLVGYDYGSNQYRAMVDCGGGSIEILPRHFDRGSDAEAYAGEVAGRWTGGQGGLPVKDGPGCDPPFVLC